MDTLRNLPSSRELEESVIGSVISCGKGAYDTASEKINDSSCFYYGRHKMVWDAIKSCADNGSPISVLTICDSMTKAGTLKEAGGSIFIKNLKTSHPDDTQLKFSAERVKEDHDRRELIKVLDVMIDMSHDRTTDITKVVSMVDGFEATTASSDTCLDLRTTVDDTAEQIIRATLNGEVSGIDTGVGLLNKILGGWQPEYHILAARPSVGKTALGIFTTMYSGKPIYFVSAEMSRKMIEMRLIGNKLGLPSHVLKNGALNKDELSRLDDAVQSIKNIDMIIEDQIKDVDIICREAHRLKRERDIGFVVVDYIQLLRYTGPGAGNREREIAEISNRLKDISKKLDIPVLALAQLSRENEKQNRRPVLADLRESGSLEQDADVVVFLHREGEPEETNILDLIVAKNRNGAIGSGVVKFTGSTGAFTDIGIGGSDEKKEQI